MDPSLIDSTLQEEEEEESKEINPYELEQFKEMVRRWMKADDDIRRLRVMIKERQEYMTQLKPSITQFMMEYNIHDINAQDESKITCDIKLKPKKVKKTEAKRRLKEFIKANVDDKKMAKEKINQAMDYVFGVKEEERLKLFFQNETRSEEKANEALKFVYGDKEQVEEVNLKRKVAKRPESRTLNF